VDQNVCSLDFIGAKADAGGGDNWRYKICNVAVKLSPPTCQPVRAGCPFFIQLKCQSTEESRGRYICLTVPFSPSILTAIFQVNLGLPVLLELE